MHDARVTSEWLGDRTESGWDRALTDAEQTAFDRWYRDDAPAAAADAVKEADALKGDAKASRMGATKALDVYTQEAQLRLPREVRQS